MCSQYGTGAAYLELFIQIVVHYAFHTGLAWTEEISRFFLYLIYTLTSLPVFRGTHIKVEIVVDLPPEKICNGVAVLVTVIQVLFSAWPAGEALMRDPGPGGVRGARLGRCRSAPFGMCWGYDGLVRSGLVKESGKE